MATEFRSLLDELSGAPRKAPEDAIEIRGIQLIASFANLSRDIKKMYDAETAEDLIKRLMNAARTGSNDKFLRGISAAKEKNNE